MKYAFYEIFLNKMYTNHMGISADSLSLLLRLINEVVDKNLYLLNNTDQYNKTIDGFQIFIDRMIEIGRTNNNFLTEDSYWTAKKRCGIIFWCE